MARRKSRSGGLRWPASTKAVPLQGGAITVRKPALLPFGAFSMAQNVRGRHPGLIKRKGYRKLHSTADSTNKACTLFQFKKARHSESHFLAQMSDGDVLEATNNPPIVTTGVFGAEAWGAGTASHIPASWANMSDVLAYANGVDQLQLWAGTTNYVSAFVKYDHASEAPPAIPDDGYDYTKEVTGGSGNAVLDSLNTLAAYECIFICTPIPVNRLTFTIPKPNGTTAVGTLSYRKNDNTWADTTETDGTSDGATLATTGGAMTLTHPSDEVPYYMYGRAGFWYRWETDTQLDAEVEISAVTYGSAFQDLRNVWNGVPQDAVEVYVEGTSQYEVYAASAVDLDELGSGKKIVIMSATRINAIYIDPGGTPNATGTNVTSLKYWDGAGLTTVGTDTDGTNGMSQAGWITFPRQATAQPRQFQTSLYYAYMYELIWDSAIAADVVVSIQTMPFYDVEDFGTAGTAVAMWKGHSVYSFNLFSEYAYLTPSGAPMVLNGPTYGILEAGDGRANQILRYIPFYSEMLVLQEELGAEGGCTTLFEGYSPVTYGKLLISVRIGILNAKCATVVEGVMTSTETEQKIKTLTFWLSRYGAIASDGHIMHVISDDIQNYWDATRAECIRRGCEKEHWLGYDSAYNVLRLGLVSGYPTQTGTATSTTSDKLVDTVGAFTTRKTPSAHPIAATIQIGDTVVNTTDNTTALVTAIDSATVLALDTDIMVSGEAYEVLSCRPNLFPVFDLMGKGWYFDLMANNMACMAEVGAESEQIATLQVGGGVADGTIYQHNYGQNDISTAITSYIQPELSGSGRYIDLREFLLQMEVQAAGDVTLTLSANGITQHTLTLSMTAEVATQDIRRHLLQLNIMDQHITLKIQHATESQDCTLYTIGAKVLVWEDR